MWSIPQAVAERQALIKQKELQKKLYQLNSPCRVPVIFNLHAGLQKRISSERCHIALISIYSWISNDIGSQIIRFCILVEDKLSKVY
jgi:hypothetical protein